MIGVLVSTVVFAIAVIGFKFSQPMAYKIILAYTVTFLPLSTVAVTAIIPLIMRLLPKSNYGQFCSAAAMIGSLFYACGGCILGAFLDYVNHLLHGSIAYYKYATLWTPLLSLACLIACFVLYGMWNRLGGDASYYPPETRQRLAGRVDAGTDCAPIEPNE